MFIDGRFLVTGAETPNSSWASNTQMRVFRNTGWNIPFTVLLSSSMEHVWLCLISSCRCFVVFQDGHQDNILHHLPGISGCLVPKSGSWCSLILGFHCLSLKVPLRQFTSQLLMFCMLVCAGTSEIMGCSCGS